VLLMIAQPMAAEGFGTLAGHFEDHTVVTYDPRLWAAASARTAPPFTRRSTRRPTCTG
jgi:hypothetical protein